MTKSKGFDETRVDHRTKGIFSKCPFCWNICGTGNIHMPGVRYNTDMSCRHLKKKAYFKAGFWRWVFIRKIGEE